jgi:predicted Fe-S protein YdhL (DUF1289 family)
MADASGEDEAPPSPCVRNCCLDDDNICMGCNRSIRYICDWHAASAAEKREILEKCDARRATHVSRARTRGF